MLELRWLRFKICVAVVADDDDDDDDRRWMIYFVIDKSVECSDYLITENESLKK